MKRCPFQYFAEVSQKSKPPARYLGPAVFVTTLGQLQPALRNKPEKGFTRFIGARDRRRNVAQRPSVGQPVASAAADDETAAFLADSEHGLAVIRMHDRDEDRALFRRTLADSARKAAGHEQTADFDHAARFAAAQSVRE